MTNFAISGCTPTQTRVSRFGLDRLLNVWRQRQTLRTLDADALRDIGLTRAQADAESRRSFWDAPESWRC